MDSILISHPAAPGLILSIPKNFSLDVAEIYWHHCLEQWTQDLKYQSNPSSTGQCQASTTKNCNEERATVVRDWGNVLPEFSAGWFYRGGQRGRFSGSCKAAWRPLSAPDRRAPIRRKSGMFRASIWQTREKFRWKIAGIREGWTPERTTNQRNAACRLTPKST